jgi:NADH-quinone oxidoreductase subunit M
MPGSPNFVGEILILFGAFENTFVFGVVASIGVVLAAVYMIRAFQLAMHNRAPENEAGIRDAGPLDFGVIAPLALVIVALGVYPQVVLERSQPTTVAKIAPARAADGLSPQKVAQR